MSTEFQGSLVILTRNFNKLRFKPLNFSGLFLRASLAEIYIDYSHQQTWPHTAVLISIFTFSFSVCKFHFSFYATRPNSDLLLFALCLKIFIKSKPTIFIFFSYLIILMAQTKNKSWMLFCAKQKNPKLNLNQAWFSVTKYVKESLPSCHTDFEVTLKDPTAGQFKQSRNYLTMENT